MDFFFRILIFFICGSFIAEDIRFLSDFFRIKEFSNIKCSGTCPWSLSESEGSCVSSLLPTYLWTDPFWSIYLRYSHTLIDYPLCSSFMTRFFWYRAIFRVFGGQRQKVWPWTRTLWRFDYNFGFFCWEDYLSYPWKAPWDHFSTLLSQLYPNCSSGTFQVY